MSDNHGHLDVLAQKMMNHHVNAVFVFHSKGSVVTGKPETFGSFPNLRVWILLVVTVVEDKCRRSPTLLLKPYTPNLDTLAVPCFPVYFGVS